MKKFVSIAILLIALSFITYAAAEGIKGSKSNAMTTSVYGTVVDEITGETLVGVAVQIDGTDQSVYTDFEGNFEFKNLTPGEYTLKTNLISYQVCSSKIKVMLEKENKISMKMKNLSK